MIKEILIKTEDGMPQFTIEYNAHENYIEFTVNEVVSWYEENVICEEELYLNGSIKWDGCSNINFEDGLHLCGKYYWDMHCKMMNELWIFATDKIEHFDKELGN